MTRRNDVLSYAPISVLVVLMAFFYAIFMLTLVPPLGSSDPHPASIDQYYPNSTVVNIVVVNFLFFMTLLSFLRASFTKPGSVPGLYPWNPDAPKNSTMNHPELDELLTQRGPTNLRGLEKKMDGRSRFCRMCGVYKPDRTHHSSNAGSCVLCLDHYCPWVRNSIGYFNKKYFFLLVFYGACSLIGFCVALGPRLIYACKHMHTVLDFFIVFAWILAVILGTVVTCFCIFHIWLMSRAYTTIEFCEKRRADPTKRNARGILVKDLYEKSPYDIGIYHNIKEVLGPWYLWLIPTRFGMANGITAGCVFDVNKEHPLFTSSIGPEVGSFRGAGSTSIKKVANEKMDSSTSALLDSKPAESGDSDLSPIQVDD